MDYDSSTYDKKEALEQMNNYFKACIGVVEQYNKVLESELGEQKELVVTQELK